MRHQTDTVHLRGTKVLVAAGDLALGRPLRSALRRMGFRHILNVCTAREVIQHLAMVRTDLLITRPDLPDLDAWRLTRMIRSGRFCSAAVPIVVVSEDRPQPVLEAIAREHVVPMASTDDEEKLFEVIDGCLSGAARPAVLVVEDDERIASLISDSLRYGFETEIRNDGESGLAAWTERHHDLVILDLVLPRMSGHEVLRGIMEIDSTQPIIILTAHATTDRHQELVLAGAVEFLAKPFHVNELRHTCEGVLRYRRLTDTHAEWKKKEKAMRQVSNRVHAADYCLSSGKAWVALQHIKSALGVCRWSPPSADEWDTMAHEFGDRPGGG
jgi:DNA-binding response OmpR family regulator